MSIVLHCSKKRKHIKKIGEFWRREWTKYKNRSDEAPETDSQDSKDHGVWPTNPNVMSYTKNKTSLSWVIYTSSTLEFMGSEQSV